MSGVEQLVERAEQRRYRQSAGRWSARRNKQFAARLPGSSGLMRLGSMAIGSSAIRPAAFGQVPGRASVAGPRRRIASVPAFQAARNQGQRRRVAAACAALRPRLWMSARTGWFSLTVSSSNIADAFVVDFDLAHFGARKRVPSQSGTAGTRRRGTVSPHARSRNPSRSAAAIAGVKAESAYV